MCKQYYYRHTDPTCNHISKRPDGFLSCGPRCLTNTIQAFFLRKEGKCPPCQLAYWAKAEQRRRFRLANTHIEF